MSFPNIPDINPYINITFEDAINLLITSIALEEVSLSKLMDAETCKILFVLNESCHKDSALQDAIAINRSVDDTIKNMIKLQMLLQFKLENVKELLPTTSTTTTTSTSSTTTTTCTCTITTTFTTTCTTSTCSTTTRKECICNISGTGKGCVTNQYDEFYCQPAVLKAVINSCDYENRYLCYCVQNDIDTLHMVASSNNIKIQNPCHLYSENIVIYGKGNIEKKSKCHPDIVGCVNYTLIFCDKKNKSLEIKMKITSDSTPELNHDSGFMQLENFSS